MAQAWKTAFDSSLLGLLLLEVASLLLQGCISQRNTSVFSADQETKAEQKMHSKALTEEELQSLEERQAILIKSRTAFVCAVDEREAHMQASSEKSTADVALREVRRETAQGAAGNWYSVIRPIMDTTIGYVWEGRRGELLYCAKNALGAVSIVRNGENLELLKSDKDGVPHFIGIVRKSGEYIKSLREDGVNTDFAPYFWNSFAEDGTPAALSKDSPVLTSKSIRPARPRKALGWLFPTSDGGFVCVPETIAPIENVLWLVRNKEGLDMVHSGPDYEGFYARVSPDCVVRFDRPFEDSTTTDWSDATWKILDENNAPKFDATVLAGWVLPERLEVGLKTWISERGILSMEGPTVTD